MTVAELKHKLEKEGRDKEVLRGDSEQHRRELERDFNEQKAAEIASLTKDFEARLEAKNDQLMAEQHRIVNEEKEKQIRNEMLESQ